MQQIDVQGLPVGRLPAPLPLYLGGWLEETEMHALGIGVQAGDLAAQSERLIPAKPKPLGDNRRPERQHRGPVYCDHRRHRRDLAWGPGVDLDLEQNCHLGRRVAWDEIR